MTETITDARLEQIALSDIDVGTRFREEFDEDRLIELTVSIKEHGLISPITLFDKSFAEDEIDGELDKDKPFLLLAGERRYRALSALKKDFAESKIFTRILSPIEIREIELFENIHRENLSWQEEVNIKKEIYRLQVEKYGEKVSRDPDDPGVSKRSVADLLGVDNSGFAKDIALAEAMENIPELASAKTKDDARKFLTKMKKDLALEELRRRQEAKQASTPEEVARKAIIDSYIIKDFFQGVKNIPDKTIDFVEIDPPYGVDLKNIKRGKEEVSGMEHYNEVPAEGYKKFLSDTMRACYKVMKEHSWGVLWFGPEPWFEVAYQCIVAAGFECRRIPLIWDKGSGQTQQPQYYLGNTYEMGFYFRKGSPALIKQGRQNIYHYSGIGGERKYHPTQRPEGLIREIILTFCKPGARILVPFLGSGTTILSASNAGMSAFGFDLSQQYKDAFIARVLNGIPGEFTD